MLDRDYDFIRELVYHHSRIHLGPDKKELLTARLGKRLRETNLTSIGEYCRFLQNKDGQGELSHLIDVISTNHTYFFREPSHFDFLAETVIPEMLLRRVGHAWTTFNVWSAACSTGEEPYSIAISLANAMGRVQPAWPARIEATDISHRALRHARIGIYRQEVLQRVPATLVGTCFQKGFGPQAGNYRVKSFLQETVTFRQMNLLDGAPPFGDRFHVIFCRNVMIYFDRPTQEELVRKLGGLLVPGGYLMVGHSESLATLRHDLEPVASAVYRSPL